MIMNHASLFGLQMLRIWRLPAELSLNLLIFHYLQDKYLFVKAEINLENQILRPYVNRFANIIMSVDIWLNLI